MEDFKKYAWRLFTGEKKQMRNRNTYLEQWSTMRLLVIFVLHCTSVWQSGVIFVNYVISP